MRKPGEREIARSLWPTLRPKIYRCTNRERIESLAAAKINNLNRSRPLLPVSWKMCTFLSQIPLSDTLVLLLMLSFDSSLSTVLDLAGKILAVKSTANFAAPVTWRGKKHVRKCFSRGKNSLWRTHEMPRRIGIKCCSVLCNCRTLWYYREKLHNGQVSLYILIVSTLLYLQREPAGFLMSFLFIQSKIWFKIKRYETLKADI